MDIAAAIRSQMLGQLIAALGGATTPAATSTKQPADFAATALGQVLQATVLGETGQGQIALRINGQTLTADVRGTALPDAARQPGAQLILRLDGAGATPRLGFVGLEQATKTAAGDVSNQLPLASTGNIRIVAQSPIAAPVDPPPSPQDIKANVINAATREAAARQGSAAPLYADLAALTGKSAGVLPRGVAEIARMLLANRLNGDRPITPDAVKQAIALSGLFSDAQGVRPDAATLDSKQLLTLLRDVLRPATDRSALPRTDAEPPRRDGPLHAQRPAVLSLGPESDAKTITATIGREVEQALERVKLHQIASLPDQRPLPPEQVRPQQLTFELPIMLGQQTAMAGFRIERDKRKAAAPGTAVNSWGVRFAIDADVLGPVHAHVRLTGQTVSVTLWAETPATHRAFVEAIPLLEAALQQNALEIGELTVFAGKPAEARAASSGHFLDKRS
jgi:hypothetical protein